MCMCGGIIEAGLIAALVGYVGKRLHKCNCNCHNKNNVDKCKHCSDICKDDGCSCHTHRCGFVLKPFAFERRMQYEKEMRKHLHKKTLAYKIVQIILGIILTVGLGMVAYGLYKEYSHHHHNYHHVHNEHCVHN